MFFCRSEMGRGYHIILYETSFVKMEHICRQETKKKLTLKNKKNYESFKNLKKKFNSFS